MLDFSERGLKVARDLVGPVAPRFDDSPMTEAEERAIAAGRWFLFELAILQSLVYRAAGLLDDERVCYDVEIAAMYEEMVERVPRLRPLRNALMGHPPFVDDVFGDEYMMTFMAAGGIFGTLRYEDRSFAFVTAPVTDHPWAVALVERFRAAIALRRDAADEREQAGSES